METQNYDIVVQITKLKEELIEIIQKFQSGTFFVRKIFSCLFFFKVNKIKGGH